MNAIFVIETASLIGVSVYATFLHLTVKRLLREDPVPETNDQDAAEAIVDLIAAKLTDCPLEWQGHAGSLTHDSGLDLTDTGAAMIVTRGATRFQVTGELRDRLLRACQIRNGQELIAGLEQGSTARGARAAAEHIPGAGVA